LQPKLPQRLDERDISGLHGDSFVKLTISDGIGFDIAWLQGGHGFNMYIFKASDVAVAHLRYGKLDRETFKRLV
jgi:hypothetical protein